MKRVIAVLFCLFLCLCSVYSESVSALLPQLSEEEYNDLLGGKMLQIYTGGEDKIARLAPEGSRSKYIAVVSDRSEKGFGVATLRFIPYSDKFSSMNKEERRIYLLNILASISTQKGLTYISHLAGEKETVLIEDTYVISDPDNRNSRIDDPVFTSVTNSYSCFIYQKDNRFGSNIYKINYSLKDDEVYMDISNNSKMKYMGITCLEKGGLHMYMDVIQADEGLLLVSMARSVDKDPTVQVLFITVDLPSAFARRIVSLGNWFEKKVSE